MKNHFYILTGGPGSGKTSVLDELKKRGYLTVPEVARPIIENQQKIGGNATHDGDQIAFRDLMLKASISDYRIHQHEQGVVFFDRGIPDILGYSKLINESATDEINSAIEKYRYNNKVFIFPPWPEIYENDALRKQNFNEAVKTYDSLIQAYGQSDYDLVEVPKKSIAARSDFIIDQLNDNHLK